LGCGEKHWFPPGANIDFTPTKVSTCFERRIHSFASDSKAKRMLGSPPERPLYRTKAAVSLNNLMSEIDESSVANLGHSGQQWLRDPSKYAVVGGTERGTML